MKTTLILILTAALLGVAVASFVVPPALSWAAPSGLPENTESRALVQIPEVIRYATAKLIYGQAVGAGIGAAIGLILGIVMAFKRRPVRAQPPAPGNISS